MNKSVPLILWVLTGPALADNEEFVYRMQRSNLDTQLQNEGFDNAAIDLVHIVAANAANRKICGTDGMEDDLIESLAKERRVPTNILLAKAPPYMDLAVSHIRSAFKDLEYCRHLEDIRADIKAGRK